MLQSLNALYTGLAGALAVETSWPEWLCRPGREWPMWLPAVQLAAEHQWPAMDEAVQVLAAVPAASRRRRQAAYEAVLQGHDGLPIALYESQCLGGRLLGPEMLAVESLYRQLGLELEGPELPDHAAVELEFLAFLTEHEIDDTERSQDWRKVRQWFIAQHAGRWLPGVGRRLSQSDDPAWAALGSLLTVLLTPPRRKQGTKKQIGLPAISSEENCSLCGFCVQVCPTQALWIAEDEQSTRLQLKPGACVRCRQCVRICDSQVLGMNGALHASATIVVLRRSARATCPTCGAATVSEAELAAVAARLGEHPRWLDYCLDCRGRQQYWN